MGLTREKSEHNKTDTIVIIYIGFSIQTHKLIARIVCRKFKHCAPIVIKKNRCEIYQFTNKNQITVIKIKQRDIKILEQYGWKFIKYNIAKMPNISDIHTITCVQFTKQFCGINRYDIQTPDGLLKYISKK